MSKLLPLYRAATALAAPLIARHLKQRLARGKEDVVRFNERLGEAAHPRPLGPLVWAHAASVGESLSMLPLVEALLEGHETVYVLMTSGTVTSAKLLEDRLPPRAFHQYVPVDRVPYVNAFLDHWRPDLVLWAESEFWPNLTTLPASRGIPMVLINGRVSPESYRKWKRWPGLAKAILKSFSLCLGQADLDAERLKHLGAEPVRSVGNLKFAVPPLPADADDLAAMSNQFGERPRWLAASTHAGEEAMVWQAHQTIAADHPGLLSVIVPRHPDRAADIARELTAVGACVARRSLDEVPSADTDIYIADTMGELGLFFRLCPISFMGKSLVDLGGQNPIEPARLESAIVFGPHMWNFPDITERLLAADGAARVADQTELAGTVATLLADVSLCQTRAANALAIAQSESAVLPSVLTELQPFMAAITLSNDESPPT
ncbi:MAG: 3-deoxy-D-manno-octulosonic acid transferase [Rhodospirillaceae bacterium]|jgi:3-deoxy-D-manno-octulosonic-acid transferase|nr:3-deoxy-D-manno-octulosonic acid transferase [Rhodospirillaceae bacterium]